MDEVGAPPPSWVPLGGDDASKPDPHRKKYRTGNKEYAVKVYTINQESRYLLVQNVPALGAQKDLLDLFALYGPLEEYRLLDDWDTEDEYTEVYWIKYKNLSDSLVAKRKLDERPFYSNILQITYAPQFETVADARQKLIERKLTVTQMCQPGYIQPYEDNSKFYSIPAIDASEVNPEMLPWAPQTRYVDPTPYDALKPIHQQQMKREFHQPEAEPQKEEVKKVEYYQDPTLNKKVESIRSKLQKSAPSVAEPADRPSATATPQIVQPKRRRI